MKGFLPTYVLARKDVLASGQSMHLGYAMSVWQGVERRMAARRRGPMGYAIPPCCAAAVPLLRLRAWSESDKELRRVMRLQTA